jgi:HD-GYP domain-containing protein (c-di-GMP phosphodiesterase class II)
MFSRFFSRKDKSATAHASVRNVRWGGLEKLKQKVDVEHLSIGMYVSELDIPWGESDFMFQGFTIKSVDEIKALRRQCKFVFVDLEKRVAANSAPGGKPRQARAQRVHFDTRSVEDEVDDAARIHAMANQTISEVFTNVRLGADIDAGALQASIRSFVESIMRNADASIWLAQLRKKSAATAQHSLNVAALSVILGKYLGYDVRELEALGICASLHDIGKTRLPDELLRNTGRLSAQELAMMETHTVHGRDILVSSRTAMSGSADVAYCHHERPDGRGYPRGLAAEQIPHMASIVAIAEAYDSMTTEQIWRPAWAPSDALRVIYSERGSQFDEELVVQFIDAIGIFPPGSIIEMTSGEIGIVLSKTGDKLRPRIILILDSDHQPMPQKVIDLSMKSTNADGLVYQIRTTHHNGSFGIDIQDFQRAGLRFG